jgi:hypothetical protein
MLSHQWLAPWRLFEVSRIYRVAPGGPEGFMYLIVIAWIYVVLMMSVAEATNSTGTVLGAIMTFLMYGLGPVALVVYLMGAPARGKALKKRAAEELAESRAATEAKAANGPEAEDTGLPRPH